MPLAFSVLIFFTLWYLGWRLIADYVRGDTNE